MRVRLVISDAHEGLKAARLAVFGGVPWQRCQFHLPPIKPQQNASAYVPKQEMKPQVASIFPNEASCLRLVSALLMETSDDWQAGKAYLTFSQ